MNTVHSITSRATALTALLAAALIIVGPLTSAAHAATYYIGQFSGSTPADDTSCGIGRGAPPNVHPCATLPFWNRNRRSILRPGDRVRLAPGTYRDSGPAAGTGYQCILLDRFARGVTYEGRTANDGPLDNHESVVIDMAGVSSVVFTGDNPCQSIAISALAKCKSEDYSDSTVRDMKFVNAPSGGARLCGRYPGNVSRNITLDRIRITNVADGGGIVVGRFDNSLESTDSDCKKAGRTVKDVSILDSEIDHVRGFPGGIQLACMDGFNVSRNRVHDICDASTCSACTPTAAGCNDRDGIQGSGGTNGIIAENEVYNVGEDGLDFGGHPLGKSHHITIERNAIHDSPKNNIVLSGGRYIVIRNNITWGRGNGYSSYSASRFAKVHNNTFWNSIFVWNYQESSEFINNIISSDRSDKTVFLDWASTNATNIWKNNIVLNRAGGTALGEDGGKEVAVPRCDGWNAARTSYNIAGDVGLGYKPPPVPCPLGPTANPRTFLPSAAGLLSFQAAGAAGQWFGPNSGANDKWGVEPLLVNSAAPNAANLHLRAGDTVARNAGVVISAAGQCGGISPSRCSKGLYGYTCTRDTDCNYTAQDYDGNARVTAGAWDIGADQFGTEASAPVLLSVDPQP